MQNALLRNRVFAIVTAVAMVFGSLSMVLVPSTASAATGGDLIKGTSLTTVYYYGFDGARYTFPNEKTYMTWFSDFSDVETISDSALADISLAGNVVYRPGTRWIKITSDPKVYAVSTDGTLMWIESEDVAVDYAGSDWASYIEDVPDVFFTDYTSGSSLTSATAYDGMMYMDGSSYYVAWDGEAQMVSSAGRSANNMQSRFFLDGTGIDTSSLSSGSDITSEVSAMTDVAQQGGDGSTSATGGDVTFKLSSSNPSSTSVTTNPNSVDMLVFDVKAGSEAAEIDQIAVKMVGLSATTDVTSVYLYEGETRLTEARSVNSSTQKATFGSLDLALDAGETRTLTVRGTISASAGDEIQFAIYEADDIDANEGSVGGSFPINGSTFTVSNVTGGTVTVIDTGSVDNPALGASDAEIGKFKITTATEAGEVESLTLKIDNASDHSDYTMWADGAEVATGEYIGDKLVVFDFATAFDIAKGQSEIFTVTADIGGEAADTISVYMDNAIDVYVIGGLYSYPMAATMTGYDGGTCAGGGSDECNYTTIQGGEVTISVSGPTAGDVRQNSQDQTLLEFSLTAAQVMTVKDLDIIVSADDDDDGDTFDFVDDSAGAAFGDADGLINTTEANLTDIKIINVDTGETLMGPLELDSVVTAGDDADQTIDFTDDFDMSAGETLYLAVVVDVDDSITAAETIGATIDISGFQAEDSNGDTICTSGCSSTDVVPTTDQNGYAQTVRAASLTLSLASTPSDVTTVHGMDDVLLNSFNLVGGSAGVVTVTEVQLSVYSDDTSGATMTLGDHATAPDVNNYIESCSIYDISGNLLDGPESPVAAGTTITFQDVNWDIAAEESERIDVRCNISNPSSATTYYFGIDIADSANDIVAEDEDGTDVDPTGDTPNGATSPTNEVTVAASGSLAVTADSSMPSADFLLTGSEDNHVASYRVTATNEDFEIQTISFTEEQATDDSTTAGDYANNISLVTMEYPLEDGTTGVATATMNSNVAKFSISSAPIFVSTDDPAIIDIYVDVPATDRNAGGSATSNEKVRMGFSDGDNSGTESFKAVGVGSGTTLEEDATGVADIGDDAYATDAVPQFVVRETKPTVSLSSSSPSGAKVVGDIEVMRFNVAASSNEDVILREFIWSFTGTNNAGGTDWRICDEDDAAGGFATVDLDLYNLSKEGTATALDDDVEWSFLDTDSSVCTQNTDTVDYIQLEFSTDAEAITVPAGETYTFALYNNFSGTIAASATNDDSVQFSLVEESSLSWMDPSLTINQVDPVIDLSDTTLVLSSNTSVATGALSAGDMICFSGTGNTTCSAGEEIALITNIATNTISMVRGYFGEEWVLPVHGDAIVIKPSTFFWEDDGVSGGLTTTGINSGWGSYLVDSLPVSGNTIQF